MKNPVSSKVDPDFQEYLKEIQKQRYDIGTDKKQKSLAKMNRVAWSVLKLSCNVDRMLKYRCPT